MNKDIKSLYFCVDGNVFAEGKHNYNKPNTAAAVAFCEWLNTEVEKTIFKPVKFELTNLGYSDVSFFTEAANLDDKEVKVVALIIAAKVAMETSEDWMEENNCYVSVEGHDEEEDPVDVVLTV